MRQALAEDDYFDLVVADVQTASPKLLSATLETAGVSRADYIIATTKVTTEASGEFIELLSFDGKQQKITAVD